MSSELLHPPQQGAVAKRKGPPLFRGDTVMIPLTRGMFATIDASDAARVLKFTWFADPIKGGGFYAARKGIGGKIYMHRYLMDARLVDHRDRDGLNNRRSNLRIATRSQNAANSKPRRTRAPFRGIYQNGKMWVARIRVNYAYIYLGTYPTPEAAAAAYDLAASAHFGEFAPKLN